MELNYSAFSLTRLGYAEYWDQIDRFTRNHTVEAQFLDPAEWVEKKAAPGRILDREKWVYENWPDDLEVLPYDDYRDVVNRSLGGFVWTVSADEHLFLPATIMLCCSAHALRSSTWSGTTASRGGTGFQVNLRFSCENELGEVLGYEPFAGRTRSPSRRTAACGSACRVRPGRGAEGEGKPCALRFSRYADLGPQAGGSIPEYLRSARPRRSSSY
jgi:hypothetical protein